LSETVDAELANLPVDMRARLEKTQKTPGSEIDLALQRAEELEK
jgi:phage-related protein